MCQRFGSEKGCRAGFCAKRPKTAPGWTEAVPAGSKRDPPLAKAEPISDSGSTSVATFLRKGKKNAVQQQLGESREDM